MRTIVHEILPGLARRNRLSKGDFMFEDLPYLRRDIIVLSSVVQWFGTSVGNCFLTEPRSAFRPPVHPEREFLQKLADRNIEYRDMPSFWCHVCTPHCESKGHFSSDPCIYREGEASARDRAVIDGLMRWLGKHSGREFTSAYFVRLARVREAASERAFRTAKRASAA